MDDTAQEEAYRRITAALGGAYERLARGYEADPDLRRDLVQDLHLALWRSLPAFQGLCSERTWAYRVAHNAAATYVLKRRRRPLSSLDDLADLPGDDDPEANAGASHALGRLTGLIHRLKPTDRQVILLYLEDLDAAAIGEITGLSAPAVAVRIHRIKTLLARQFRETKA